LCIKTVVMDDGSITYIKGREYHSTCNDYLTNEQHNAQHQWCEGVHDPQNFFVDIKEHRNIKIKEILG